MKEQRWPWLVAVGLMLAAAVAAGWSTYLHWLPCRGSMLRGSIIHDYRYDYDGGKFSDLCLRRMDGDQGPWESELQVVAMVLLGAAWLTLILGLRWQLRTKALAALPGLATLALAGAVAIGDAALMDGEVPLILAVGIELSAVVALVDLMSESDAAGRRFRLLVVLWGTTAFGFIHFVTEYVTMTNFSDANWDSPPGTGYLTVATITVSAILTAILTAITTLRTPRKNADDEPGQADHSGSLTLA